MDISKHKNELLFLPLGGSGEIGLNFNLYHYKGKWLIVDFGAGFADDYYPGVDILVPDISYIIKHKKDIAGIVLTHAHEDHLGSIQYLWDEVKCTIYTTKFTSAFLKTKLTEVGLDKRVPIIEIEEGARFEVGPFDLEYVSLAHSAPEMQALMIRTELGNIFHTGDWKFDHDPIFGNPANEDLLKKIGDEGVLALVGDSTNVFNHGTSGSEGDLRKSLTNIIKNCDNLVLVTTFASNVARLDTIIKGAKENGRKILLAGKSLWRVVRAAQESGYIDDMEEFLDIDSFGKFPRDKLLILCTGCQGEPFAAATKIANETHRIKLKPGDNVIFSSKIIPGNEKRIYRQFNQLAKLGVEVFTEKDHFVHVSGHPSRDELKRMYELIRPKVAIPVHGELVHMKEHAKMALKWGAEKAINVENGHVVRLSPKEPEKISVVNVGYLAVDGNYLLPSSSAVMKMRRRIQRDGVVIVVLILSIQSNTLLAQPIITAPGSLDSKEDQELFAKISSEVRRFINDVAPINKKLKIKSEKTSQEALGAQIKTIVKKIIKKEVGKEPVIEIHVERV